MGSFWTILGVAFALIHMLSCAYSTEFLVGGEDGWIVPKSRSDGDAYNKWASNNRFKENDTLRFKYEKDSVMVVTEEEYKKCRSSRPEFFANNGNTVFKFDRSGLFYFISGVSGHCDKGQKMIIKVLETASPQSPPPPEDSEQNLAVKMAEVSYVGIAVIAALVLSVIGMV